MSNKLLAILLFVWPVMLFTILGVLPVKAWAASVFQDNFDSDATGQPPAGWNYFSQGSSASIQVDDTVFFGFTGKSAHFLDTSSSEQAYISHTFTPTTSLILEYYMRTHNQNYEGAFVELQGDVDTSYSVNFSNGTHGGTAGYIGLHGESAGWIYDLMPYQEDTWYYVRRTLTLFGDGTSSGSFYVEELVHGLGDSDNISASYDIGSEYANAYIDTLLIWTSGDEGADSYIDEIVVSAIPIPGAIWLLGSGLIGFVGIREKLYKVK